MRTKFKFPRGAAFFAVFSAALLLVLSPRPALSEEKTRAVLFREDFHTLSQWTPVYFPRIERHSTYAAVVKDGLPMLEARSDRSASAIRWVKDYDAALYPRLRWLWKIEHVYEKGDETKKSGDDYALRVYVMFRYDPAKASAWQRLRYGAAKTLYGQYPPGSALLYIWSNKPHEKRILTSPYADNVKMVILETGNSKAGQWIVEDVNVLADYRAAFGKEPGSPASLAVMNDSDNTGEASVSWLQWIEISR